MHSVVVVSSVAIYREGIAALLSRQDDFDRVAAYGHLAAVDGEHEVCVLDTSTFDEASVALFLLAMNRAAVPVVVVGLPESKREVVDCLEAGASGYVTRDQSLDDLLATIRQTLAHGACVQQDDVAAVLRRVRTARPCRSRAQCAARRNEQPLTVREGEVATLLTEGCSNREIARSLGISIHTVKHHVRSTLAKLGLERRSEAIELRGRVGASAD